MTTDSKKLSNLFYEDEPLGPEKITEIRQVPELIFKDTVPHKRLLQKPNMIIGRRGSGKSSILSSYYIDGKYEIDLILAIPQNIAMSRIVGLVNELVLDEIYVENITPIWEFLLICCYASKFVEFLKNRPAESESYAKTITLLTNYLSKIDLDSKTSVEEQIVTCCHYISKNKKIIPYILGAKIGNLTLSEARSLIDQTLSDMDLQGIILIDSLEEMHLNIDAMHPALGAFLRTFDSIQKAGSRIDLICNIPAEVYFPLYEEISVAPIKDFNKSQVLHWSASELLQICAHRLSVYMLLSENPEVVSWVKKFEFSKKSDAKQFFSKILPKTLTNGVGIEEDTFAYVFRHTQLLPRHLIILFNSIFAGLSAVEIMNGNVSGDKVVESIHQKEALISTDIIDGYNNRYHGLSSYNMFSRVRDLCTQTLNELDLEFGYKDIDKIYKQKVKNSIPYIYDVNDALRVLIEIGAVGKKIETGSGRYKKGLFEYTAPHKLIYKSTDRFLIHPCFVGEFCSPPNNLNFAVYPQGASFDDDNYRMWQDEVS